MTFFQLPRLSEMSLGMGKRTRLTRMMFEKGPANGTLLILPIDQGLEHGPMDFFENPDSKDPNFELDLAEKGGYSAFACHYGLAKKYFYKYAGRIPLILKINGKTAIPSDAGAFSPLTATVADAVHLGADAVGYTLFIGSPSQDRDIQQLTQVRRDCDIFGMPLIIWAYPRGTDIVAKGGIDTLYAVDYAARVACEVGADIVKVNTPKKVKDAEKETYFKFLEKKPETKPYIELENASDEERMRRVVQSAGRTFVLISGGGKLGDNDLVAKTEFAMKAGVTGLIYGRNMWQRPMDQALRMTKDIKQMLAKYPRPY